MRHVTIGLPGVRFRLLPRRLSLLRLIERLQHWCERAAQRRRLGELDDRMLRDIGVGRSEAYRESGKWFWQD